MNKNPVVKIRGGFRPVQFGNFFRKSLIEKGQHLVQHILNVEEIYSGTKIITNFITEHCFTVNPLFFVCIY